MKRLLPWGTVAVVSILCTGCWDAVEVNRLAIVSMAGFDLVKPGDPRSLTRGVVQIARPSQLGGPEQQSPAGSLKGVLIEEAVGKTPGEVASRLARQTPRYFYLPHRDVAVVGEDYARHGISTLLDEMLRNPQSRPRTFLLTAYHTTAKDILQLAYGLNRLPAEAVLEMEESGQVQAIDVKRFTQDLLSPSDPFTMGIIPIPTIQQSNAFTFDVRNIAVYRKDRFVGWLTPHESDGFMWVRGKLMRAITTVHIPQQGDLSCSLTLLHSSTKVRIMHGKPSVSVHVFLANDVIENGTSLNLALVHNVELVRRAVERHIHDEIQACIKTLQQRYDADCLGFARTFYKYTPNQWREMAPRWREIYPTLPVDISVECRVHRSGDIGPSPRRTIHWEERGWSHG